MIPEFSYAPYVWSSYGLFAVIVVWQAIVPIVQRRRILAELAEEAAMREGNYHDSDA